jgi:PAS domain S-box-containing protein
MPVNALHTNVTDSAVNDPAFSLGIVRLSPTRDVTFINRAAMEMVGNEMAVGTNLSSLILEDNTQSTLCDAMSARFEKQRGSSYRIVIRRRDLGTRVRLLISALPEYDANGTLVGSIGFFCDESVDAAAAEIHRIIADATDPQALLAGVTAQVREVCNFDSIVVTGISRNRTHLQRIFEEPSPPPEIVPTQWYVMEPFVRTMIENFEPGPHNLKALIESPEFQALAEANPNIRAFADRGFHHDMRLGVKRGDCLVATITVMRKSDLPFTPADFQRFQKLPLPDAVNAALSFETQKDLEFGFNFVRDIGAAGNDSQKIAQQLVDQLAQHHKWDHVSLFRVDEEGLRLDMICQAGTRQYPACQVYSQPSAAGFVGQAYTEKRTINIGNVLAPEHEKRYLKLMDHTLSELVMPVPGTNGRWLLNIESSLLDAFADDEQQSVETQLHVAGFILERMGILDQETAILNAVADAVILTTDTDIITHVNPAAEELLGRTDAELLHGRLANFIVAEGEMRPNIEATGNSDALLGNALESKAPIRARCQRKDGTLIPVLLSAAHVPTRLGGRVFVASDLRKQELAQRMDAITKVFNQLASEIRIPLALTEAYLAEAAQHADEETSDLIDRAHRQLRKTDMPLERLMRTALQKEEETQLPRSVFDLRTAVEDIVSELPASEAKAIDIHSNVDSIVVRAARHELLLCVKSLLSYLVRRRAEVEKVEISLERDGDTGLLSLGLPGELNGHMQPSPPDEDDLERDVELELAEPMVRNLMARMDGGRYAAMDTGHRHFQLQFNAGD